MKNYVYLTIILICTALCCRCFQSIFVKSSSLIQNIKARKYNNILFSSWEKDAIGLNQMDLMALDQCILVDENDMLRGFMSKQESHSFTESSPYGHLHRAFSVFLFNNNNELLIQQRAAEKITFPNVWSNTCCSHPLTGFEPSEVDSDTDVQNGNIIGIKRAAQRKLEHELGIKKNLININNFKYLTRIHYCAKDSVTYGENSMWGEHEIDYILLMKVDNSLPLQLNKEEVQDAKWVNQVEFQSMINDPKLLWSPWFRVIASKHLLDWWNELDITLNTEKFVNHQFIYRYL